MRLVDPYLSETQLQFAHYSPKQQLDYVGGKNIITFYDTNPEAFPIVSISTIILSETRSLYLFFL